jgi:hypothetical protein
MGAFMHDDRKQKPQKNGDRDGKVWCKFHVRDALRSEFACHGDLGPTII